MAEPIVYAARRRDDIAWVGDGIHLAAREVSFDRGTATWFLYDVVEDGRAPLWPDREALRGTVEPAAEGSLGNAPQDAETAVEVAPGALRHLAWSPDGNRVAGVVRTAGGSQLWIVEADGGSASVRQANSRLMFPAWTPAGDRVACLSMSEESPVFQARCAESTDQAEPLTAYGPFAFSPGGERLYYAAPDETGSLDLWVLGLDSGSLDDGGAQRLTHFARDSYAPSVSRAGDVLFKVQDYRASIAVAPAAGGPSRAVTSFQSETPSWNWDGTRIAFTYGAWRRVTDDIHYPDIDQQIGTVVMDEAIPASGPTVVRSSYSEDQGMHWSPNGHWIVLHTHADGTDDIWLQPADGSQPALPISTGGHETGWPRWSPDGRWVVYPSQALSEGGRRSVLYLIGVDQTTGAVTEPQQVTFDPSDKIHPAYAPTGEQIAFTVFRYAADFWRLGLD